MFGRIAYVSRAAPDLSAADVRDIIRIAHARNGAEALNGALVFIDGWFVQVLEGPCARLEARFERIARDPRHGAVRLRLREQAHVPLFEGQRIVLRARPHLDPALLERFEYSPGFPVGIFPADVLVEFVLRACTCHRDRRVGRS